MDKKIPYELPLCSCGKHNRYRKAWRKDGVTPIFQSKCDHCRGMAKKRNARRRNAKFYLNGYSKKNVCDKCGFIAENSCQLDIDHIDGDKKNNELNNLQTLCANCHRLKTYLNKDWQTHQEEVE